ncbi:ribonuclease H-like domain-containing protein [Tanacetum coccineum]
MHSSRLTEMNRSHFRETASVKNSPYGAEADSVDFGGEEQVPMCLLSMRLYIRHNSLFPVGSPKGMGVARWVVVVVVVVGWLVVSVLFVVMVLIEELEVLIVELFVDLFVGLFVVVFVERKVVQGHDIRKIIRVPRKMDGVVTMLASLCDAKGVRLSKASKRAKDDCKRRCPKLWVNNVKGRCDNREVEVDVASKAEEEDEDDADEESVIDSLLSKGVFWTLTCCCSKMRLVVIAGPLFLLANDAYTWNGKEWQGGVWKLEYVLEQGEVKQLIAIVLLKNVPTLNSLWMWVVIPASPNSELTVDVDVDRDGTMDKTDLVADVSLLFKKMKERGVCFDIGEIRLPLLSYGDGLYAFNLWMIFIITEAVQFDVVGFFFFFFFYFSDPLILILLLLLRLLLLLLLL